MQRLVTHAPVVMALPVAMMATILLAVPAPVAPIVDRHNDAHGGCTPPSLFAEPQPAQHLAAVQFASTMVGWVVGRSVILHTVDGGAHWQVQRRDPHAQYGAIDAVNASRAWVVDRHHVLTTGNGGRSWHAVGQPCLRLVSLHFSDAHHGMAVRPHGLLRTSDGGQHWHAVTSPSEPQSVCLSDRRHGWLGAHGQVFRTSDAGQHWRLAVAGPRTQQPHRRGSEYVAEVQCVGRESGWAELVGISGASSQQPHIAYRLHRRHGRAVFAEQYFPHPGVRVHRESPGNYFAGFSAIDPAHAAFVDNCAPCDYPAPGTNPGTAPFEIVSRHGHQVPRHAGLVRHVDEVTGVAFISATDGWALGSRSHFRHHHLTAPTWKIEHTTDGGAHWTTQRSR